MHCVLRPTSFLPSCRHRESTFLPLQNETQLDRTFDVHVNPTLEVNVRVPDCAENFADMDKVSRSDADARDLLSRTVQFAVFHTGAREVFDVTAKEEYRDGDDGICRDVSGTLEVDSNAVSPEGHQRQQVPMVGGTAEVSVLVSRYLRCRLLPTHSLLR